MGVKHKNWIPATGCGEQPLLALAPMADLTHRAFRQAVAELGGCDLFYTEMVNSRIAAAMPVKNDPYCQLADSDRPCICQLVGNDPERMARSAEKLEPLGFAGFDINMGCSRRAVVRRGWGAALLSDVKRAISVVKAVVESTGLPVSIKIRSMPGHDISRLKEFCAAMQEAGVQAIAFHARAPEDGFKRRARMEEVAELASFLEIPVIANGDIFSRKGAEQVLSTTGCAGVMIGRAALVRPWIFREIKEGRPWSGDPFQVLQRIGRLIHRLLPQDMKLERFILLCTWFLRNWAFYHHLVKEVRKQKDIEAILGFLRQRIAGLQPVKAPVLQRM